MAYPSDLVRTKDWGTETLTDSDLEGQLDLIITWVDAHADETTGHSHDGTANEGPNINLTSAVTGTLPLGNGGTGQTTIAGLLGLVYPVGCIYTNITGTNLGTELGFGTWTAFGAGRMLVGYDSGDTDFDTAEETGGAKTKTIAKANLPAESLTVTGAVTTSGGTTEPFFTQTGTGDATEETENMGSGTALDVVNPYIVVHFWKRTV